MAGGSRHDCTAGLVGRADDAQQAERQQHEGQQGDTPTAIHVSRCPVSFGLRRFPTHRRAVSRWLARAFALPAALDLRTLQTIANLDALDGAVLDVIQYGRLDLTTQGWWPSAGRVVVRLALLCIAVQFCLTVALFASILCLLRAVLRVVWASRAAPL